MDVLRAHAEEPRGMMMMTDANYKPLKQGRVYRLAGVPSNNRFTCIRGGEPNTAFFRRVHDNNIHRGREFVEWRDDGRPYYALQEASDER